MHKKGVQKQHSKNVSTNQKRRWRKHLYPIKLKDKKQPNELDEGENRMPTINTCSKYGQVRLFCLFDW